jgi:hypothetical protein
MIRSLAISALVVSFVALLPADLAVTAPPGQRQGTRPGSRKFLSQTRVARPAVNSVARSQSVSRASRADNADIAIPVRRVRRSPAFKGVPERWPFLRGCR